MTFMSPSQHYNTQITVYNCVSARDAEVRFRTGPKIPEPPNRTEVRFRFRFGPGPEVCGPVLVHGLGEFFEPGLNPFEPEPSSLFHCKICIYNAFKFLILSICFHRVTL